MTSDTVQVYHGTSKKSLAEFDKQGYVPEGTYWGTYAVARSYAEAYGDNGVVLVTKLHGRCVFKANMTLANQYFDDGELESLPDENDAEFSLKEYDSVIAGEAIFDYEVL